MVFVFLVVLRGRAAPTALGLFLFLELFFCGVGVVICGGVGTGCNGGEVKGTLCSPVADGRSDAGVVAAVDADGADAVVVPEGVVVACEAELRSSWAPRGEFSRP